ncbi:hypothetical protein M8J76_013777 [Diaphorina citri]|nr:hypothetical protein M8J76_013777 [Diaphorina citri]
MFRNTQNIQKPKIAHKSSQEDRNSNGHPCKLLIPIHETKTRDIRVQRYSASFADVIEAEALYYTHDTKQDSHMGNHVRSGKRISGTTDVSSFDEMATGQL